jgi:hypothetical protein
MGILIRQEGHDSSDNKWIIEIRESWNVFDDKEETELTNFLKSKMIPYSVSYIFEGTVVSMQNAKYETSKFEEAATTVHQLLTYKNSFVNPKPTPLTIDDVEVADEELLGGFERHE